MAKKKPSPTDKGEEPRRIRVRVDVGKESSTKSGRVFAAAKARAHRISKHPSVTYTFPMYGDGSFEYVATSGGLETLKRVEHAPVVIIAYVEAASMAEAKEIVNSASFTSGARRRRR